MFSCQEATAGATKPFAVQGMINIRSSLKHGLWASAAYLRKYWHKFIFLHTQAVEKSNVGKERGMSFLWRGSLVISPPAVSICLAKNCSIGQTFPLARANIFYLSGGNVSSSTQEWTKWSPCSDDRQRRICLLMQKYLLCMQSSFSARYTPLHTLYAELSHFNIWETNQKWVSALNVLWLPPI